MDRDTLVKELLLRIRSSPDKGSLITLDSLLPNVFVPGLLLAETDDKLFMAQYIPNQRLFKLTDTSGITFVDLQNWNCFCDQFTEAIFKEETGLHSKHCHSAPRFDIGGGWRSPLPYCKHLIAVYLIKFCPLLSKRQVSLLSLDTKAFLGQYFLEQ